MEIDNAKKKKPFTMNELISRAEATDKAEKFPISSNHYFSILSLHYDELAKNKKKFNEIIQKFIFGIILLPVSPQKERLLNYALQNDNLNIFQYKKLLEKFLNYELVYIDDVQSIMSNCPESHKNFNYNKAVFEHNIHSLSKVFYNISYDSAEKFLKMKIDQILNYTFKMSAEGKINAKIDEKKMFIIFESEPSISLNFDEQIKYFSLKAKALGEYIKSK